jgi:hypothetical protein
MSDSNPDLNSPSNPNPRVMELIEQPVDTDSLGEICMDGAGTVDEDDLHFEELKYQTSCETLGIILPPMLDEFVGEDE